MIREVRAYRERVVYKDRHRLYEVEGVWHMSGTAEETDSTGLELLRSWITSLEP